MVSLSSRPACITKEQFSLNTSTICTKSHMGNLLKHYYIYGIFQNAVQEFESQHVGRNLRKCIRHFKYPIKINNVVKTVNSLCVSFECVSVSSIFCVFKVKFQEHTVFYNLINVSCFRIQLFTLNKLSFPVICYMAVVFEENNN